MLSISGASGSAFQMIRILLAKRVVFGNRDGMCIVAFAWQAHPRWKLIAVGNRDEMHARPADPLHRWDQPRHLLAGRDTQAGGTWLGVSEQGRLAVVTNLSGYGTPDSGKNSRGDLLKDFLSGQGAYSDFSPLDFPDFNPFNLITVTGDKALVHSNRPDPFSNALVPGIYGLSNGPLDKPWPKSGHLKISLEKWMDEGAASPELLLEPLMDQTSHGPQAEGEPDTEAGPALNRNIHRYSFAIPFTEPAAALSLRLITTARDQ